MTGHVNVSDVTLELSFCLKTYNNDQSKKRTQNIQSFLNALKYYFTKIDLLLPKLFRRTDELIFKSK